MANEKKSIYDGAKYLYAEQLKGKRVTLTIKGVTSESIIGDGGRKSQGFALSFAETDKQLVISGMTIRRQLAMACETDDPDAMIGRKITLYPIASTKSISGQAIRIAVPEAHA